MAIISMVISISFLSYILSIKCSYSNELGQDFPERGRVEDLSNKILIVDLGSFEGDEVSNFLSYLDIQPLSRTPFVDKPGYLSGVLYEFEENIEVKILVNNYRFMSPFDTSMNWDLNSFEGEIISSIEVYMLDTIIFSS